ncbi:MAG: hypothetical protein NTV03_02540 [Candidatus Nomurabacteria bacterium]|nr:hypothetical protein [Candidatus Nomurabacteria bacterium]
MIENKPLQLQHNMSKIEMEELLFDRQIRETGISSDYFNEGVVIIFHVKNLLEKQNKKLQKQLLEEIKNFHSYSEYMTKKMKPVSLNLKDLLWLIF